MRMPLKSLLVAALGAALMASAHAWDSTGHQIVAVIARKHLKTPAAQAAFDQLVAQFPSVDDVGHYDGVSIANWMDDIRDYNNPGFGEWHFIDIGLPGEGHDEPQVIAHRDDVNENVVTGLRRAFAVLEGGSDPLIKNKSQALAMVCHLVGDIHQPLHCASHYFAKPVEIAGKSFPTDRGGNEVSINSKIDRRPDGKLSPELELHSLWDGAYRAGYHGADDTISLERTHADVMTRAPKDPSQLKVPRVIGHNPAGALVRAETIEKAGLPEGADAAFHGPADFEAWANESHAIAVKTVYGTLKFGAADPNHLQAHLDNTYVDSARTIASAQIHLAGLRLAAVLDAALGH